MKPVSKAVAHAAGDDALAGSLAPNRRAERDTRSEAIKGIEDLVPLKIKSWLADRRTRDESLELEGVGPGKSPLPKFI